MITISIILPIRNEEKYIEKTLKSVIDNNDFNEHMELLIIDGKSDDNTVRVVKKIIESYNELNIRVIRNEFMTVPHAMNLGIKEARGGIIIRIDAHSIYPKNYISTLVYWLDKLNVDNVGGIIDTMAIDKKLSSIAIAQTVSHKFGVGNSQFRTLKKGDPIEVDTVPFGCYKREVFDKIGLYDTDLIRNQDDELNARLIKNGGKIFLIPDLKIEYFARDSFGKMFKMFYQYGLFKPLVNMKLKQASTVRQFIPLLFVLFLIFGVIFSFCSPIYFYLFVLGLIIYFGINIFFSLKIAKEEKNIVLVFYLIGSFFLIHISYGLGYLKGILDFIILKKHKKENLNKMNISR